MVPCMESARQSSPDALLGVDDRFCEIPHSLLASDCCGRIAALAGCDSYSETSVCKGGGADHAALRADWIACQHRLWRHNGCCSRTPKSSAASDSDRCLAVRFPRHCVVMVSQLAAGSRRSPCFGADDGA